MNVTLTLPFGTYYVVIYNGSRVTWFSMVILRSNQTINVSITHALTINMTHPVPGEWVDELPPRPVMVNEGVKVIYRGRKGNTEYYEVKPSEPRAPGQCPGVVFLAAVTDDYY